jgi:hypothetical protein
MEGAMHKYHLPYRLNRRSLGNSIVLGIAVTIRTIVRVKDQHRAAGPIAGECGCALPAGRFLINGRSVARHKFPRVSKSQLCIVESFCRSAPNMRTLISETPDAPMPLCAVR